MSRKRVPPRWFVVGAWHVHRAIYRLTGSRAGLWPPRPGHWDRPDRFDVPPHPA